VARYWVLGSEPRAAFFRRGRLLVLGLNATFFVRRAFLLIPDFSFVFYDAFKFRSFTFSPLVVWISGPFAETRVGSIPSLLDYLRFSQSCLIWSFLFTFLPRGLFSVFSLNNGLLSLPPVFPVVHSCSTPVSSRLCSTF